MDKLEYKRKISNLLKKYLAVTPERAQCLYVINVLSELLHIIIPNVPINDYDKEDALNLIEIIRIRHFSICGSKLYLNEIKFP